MSWLALSVLIGSSLFSMTAAPNTVLLVRHAEKEATGSDPALTAAGVQRARLLAEMLRQAKVSAIYATDKLRTQQTAGPAAKMLELKPIIIPQKETARLLRSILEQSGESVLVVGHTNTIPEIIKALGGWPDRVIDESDYGNLFVLTLRPGQSPVVVVLRYGAN